MNSPTLILSLTILASSFWGSWHCAGMCSPIASLMAQRKNLWGYHLGRGLSYILIGWGGGFLGSFFLASEFHEIRIYSSLLFALILLVMGVGTLLGRVWVFNFKNIHQFYRPSLSGPSLGLLSVFLPCGWLYTYVLAATATQSSWGGALVMFLFWLGGLPALTSIPIVMRQLTAAAPRKKQWLSGIVLIIASLYSLVSFYFLH